MIAEEQHRACAALLESAGLPGAFSIHPIAGGGNNQVFRVELSGTALLLKSYFRHPDDPRDRLGTEFAFARFAWRNGLRAIPRPVACDHDRRMGLFEFVEGRRPRAGEVDADCVGQALSFFRELNHYKSRPGAAALPDGSEACFSTRDHLDCVDRRVGRLLRIDPSSELDREATDLIRGNLLGAWHRVREGVCRWAGQEGARAEAPLPVADRCLSPSDFGYHNALREAGGRLRFVDFEYAGWDDPAKVVCDFFCHPAVPVPLSFFATFAGSVSEVTSDPRRHLRRCDALLPLYRVKWCCILLNDFLPVGRERRRFAGTSADRETRKAEQLRKARAALDELC